MADLAGMRRKGEEILARARQGAVRVREKTARIARTGTRSVLVTGTAFGLGYAEGRGTNLAVFGLDADKWIALAAHGLALTGQVGGEMAEHAHAIGDGALGVAGYKFGVEVGRGAPARPPAR